MRRERGQALVYGIFMLLAGLVALFFLFNTGQLSSEKSKLVNTADAVAYSAGVMHARALNFDAYGNRALIAHEVLVAQAVSVSSWGQYVKETADNMDSTFPGCDNYYVAVGRAAVQYGALYGARCYGITYAGEYIAQVAEQIPAVTEQVVKTLEMSKSAIQASQALLHSGALLVQARGRVMQEVANRNYRDDGRVTVAPVGGIAAAGMTDDWNGFAQRYAGEDRGRFAEVTKLAAYSDNFVERRNWTATAELHPDSICAAFGRKNEVRRRGGTELIGYDEWKAEDTESYWEYRGSVRWGRPRCRGSETAIGWGEQQAHPENEDQDESRARLGGSPSTNPRAHRSASSEEWTNYTGLPAFYDLSRTRLGQSDPRLQFSVRVARAAAETRTSEARSGVRSSPRINAFQNNFAGGEMVAVASSEVFFERPDAHRENVFGRRPNINRPFETGSLFNPYWQVRLIHIENDVALQRTRQLN